MRDYARAGSRGPSITHSPITELRPIGASIEPVVEDPRAAATIERSLRRSLPFVGAVLFGLLLLPLQDVPIKSTQLAVGIAAIAFVMALGIVLGGRVGTPKWMLRLLPFAFLLAVAVLRDATGGALSGYGTFFYLAPFWVAMYDTRRQVLLVIVGMFVVQASAGILDADVATLLPLRRALLAAVVIGLISLAVQRTIEQVRAAEQALAGEAEQRRALNLELARSNDRLERSNRELEQFAYVSSHDLQEPLRMIRSFSQLLRHRHAEAFNAEASELLGFVVDGAERAQQLVNDLLEYSRVETSGRSFDDVDLDDCLDRALATLESRIDETSATIERTRPLGRVQGDAGQLDRLLVNLVGNALKYRDPGRPPIVRIESRRTGPRGPLRVTVADNGIGFDQRHAEQVFRMFHRLHGRSEYEGTGIGLAICARIVERHGGTITADGRPGEGATFTFTIGDPTE